MKYKELAKKSNKDLQKMLHLWRDELRELRFKDSNDQLKNVRQIRVLRQQIAWVLTLLNGGLTETTSTADLGEDGLILKQ